MAEAKVNKIVKDFEKALDTGDDAVAFQKMKDLEKEIAEMGALTDNLKPPREQFDDLVNEVESMIHDNMPKISNADDILKNLETRKGEGYQAYTNQNQQSLSEAYQAIKSLLEHIKKTIAPKEKGERPPLHLILPMFVQDIIDKFKGLIRECSDDGLIREAQQHIETLRAIPSNLPNEAAAQAYLPKVRQAYKFMERMERMLGRTPSKKDSGIPGI